MKREKKELRELLEEETNQYKRNALESELRSVEDARKLLTNLIQSLQSEPSGCEGANGRNSEQGETEKVSQFARVWGDGPNNGFLEQS
jgi:predicted  nucleic acid-binding Zn-ribbon protein